MYKIGIVISKKKNLVSIAFSYHKFHFKYKQLQLKLKKYLYTDTRNELCKGDIVLINILKNKLIKILN